MGRGKTIFDDVVRMPWPFGLVAAALTFILVQWTLSDPPVSGPGAALFPFARAVGWFFTALFLLASFLAFLRQRRNDKRYQATRSMADIRSLHWRQFELLIETHFRQQGYFVVETAVGPDGGADLILRRDGEKTYVQCKHWKTRQVGVGKVRELLGSMTAGGAQNGIFVTSGNYTKAARKLARQSGIRLIDGDELAGLLANSVRDGGTRAQKNSGCLY